MFAKLLQKYPAGLFLPSNASNAPPWRRSEGRQLMSLGPIFGPINTTTRNMQSGSDNATSAGGSSVVVWTDVVSDGANGSPFDYDIRKKTGVGSFFQGKNGLTPILLQMTSARRCSLDQVQCTMT